MQKTQKIAGSKIKNRGPFFYIFLLALIKKRWPLADGQALVSNTDRRQETAGRRGVETVGRGSPIYDL